MSSNAHKVSYIDITMHDAKFSVTYGSYYALLLHLSTYDILFILFNMVSYVDKRLILCSLVSYMST